MFTDLIPKLKKFIVGLQVCKPISDVTSQWHIKKLCKMHEHVRKVTCSVAWHPSSVSCAVARAGQGTHTKEGKVCACLLPSCTRGTVGKGCSGCWQWCNSLDKRNFIARIKMKFKAGTG